MYIRLKIITELFLWGTVRRIDRIYARIGSMLVGMEMLAELFIIYIYVYIQNHSRIVNADISVFYIATTATICAHIQQPHNPLILLYNHQPKTISSNTLPPLFSLPNTLFFLEFLT